MPVRANPGGGSELSTGTAQDDKIIRLALSSDENENAFQQNVGIGEAMIFGTNDEFTQISVLGRLRTLFKRFEALKRFKLREDTIAWESVDGELILSFKYVNLESDEERDFRSDSRSTSGIGGT